MSQTQQPSIRSFFQPRPPVYATPPSTTSPSTTDLSGHEQSDNAVAKAPLPPTPPPPPQQPLSPPMSSLPPRREPSPIAEVQLPASVPVLPPPPSLPPQASIVPVAETHVPVLRRINSLLLPVAYPDSFYSRILDPLASGLFSRTILWKDGPAAEPKVIGGLVCRLESNPFLDASGKPVSPRQQQQHLQSQVQATASGPPSSTANPLLTNKTPYHAIYIQSLTLLSPYRSQGLAAAALEHIVASASLLPATGSNIDVRTVYAHVWTENHDGLKWYESRGFHREGREPVKGYYFKLRPDTAWIVSRQIGPDAPVPPPTSRSPSSQMTSGPPAGGVTAAAVNLPPIGSGSSAPPPPSASRPPFPARSTASSANSSSLSFQNMRAETEWNDLPPEMMGGPPSSSRSNLLAPGGGSTPASGASSRSSSTARKKRDRAYPPAAFGS